MDAKLTRFYWHWLKNPVKDHDWIGTFSWRFWGKRNFTIHLMCFRHVNYSLAFWVGTIGEQWPGQPGADPAKAHLWERLDNE